MLSNTNPPLFLSVFALVDLAEVKKDVLCRNITDDVISISHHPFFQLLFVSSFTFVCAITAFASEEFTEFLGKSGIFFY